LVHENISAFECQLCPKKYQQNYLLKRHYISIHKEWSEYEVTNSSNMFNENCNNNSSQTKNDTTEFIVTPSNCVNIEIKE
jgi:hypothetical protein